MALELEYDLEETDWVAFHEHATPAENEVRQSSSHTTLFALLGAAVVDLGGFLFEYRLQFPFVLSFFVVYVRAASAAGARARRLYLRSVITARLSSPAFTHHRLRIEEDALYHDTDGFDMKFRWTAIERIDETPGHLFGIVAGSPGIIIPKRAFEDDATATAFLEQLRSRSGKGAQQ